MKNANGRDLVMAVLNGEKASRTPWIPYTGVQIANLKNYQADEILQDGEKLTEVLLESHRQYNPDGMPVIFDLQVEAEILGCELLWAKDSPPTVSSHPLVSDSTIPTMKIEKEDGRLPLILETMRNIKSEVGDTTALYGLICGPFTLASHLRSTQLFMDMYDDEEYVKALMEYCTDIFLQVADYYIAAGMDVIGAVDPLVSQISPDSYRQYLSKPYSRLFDALREKGVKSSFFVCGDATKNMDEMAMCRPDCLSIDENIDIIKAAEVAKRHNIAISGNLQLTVVMLLGNQKDNQKAACELIKTMSDFSFLLAPGCDIPFNVPVENIIGIGQAVENPEAVLSLLASYEREMPDIKVEMPDYENLDHILIEVLTIDSQTCAACGYMKAAADEMEQIYGDKVMVVERKILEAENLVRVENLGVSSLPTMVINGKAKFISIIPTRREFQSQIDSIL